MTIACLLWLSGFVGAILSAMGRCPLWVPVMLVSFAGLLGCLPLR